MIICSINNDSITMNETFFGLVLHKDIKGNTINYILLDTSSKEIEISETTFKELSLLDGCKTISEEIRIDTIDNKSFILIDAENFFLKICRDINGNIIKYACMNTRLKEVEVSIPIFNKLSTFYNDISIFEIIQINSIDNMSSLCFTNKKSLLLRKHKCNRTDIVHYYFMNGNGKHIEISKNDFEKLISKDIRVTIIDEEF